MYYANEHTCELEYRGFTFEVFVEYNITTYLGNQFNPPEVDIDFGNIFAAKNGKPISNSLKNALMTKFQDHFEETVQEEYL
jgi:hypothetical protein